jgi:hypothetical protein
VAANDSGFLLDKSAIPILLNWKQGRAVPQRSFAAWRSKAFEWDSEKFGPETVGLRPSVVTGHNFKDRQKSLFLCFEDDDRKTT